MDDLRKEIKDYNQSVLDLSFECRRDTCPGCKKKCPTLPNMMSRLDNSASGKMI